MDISYIGRVMADFVPNFVAMATGVGRSTICLASFNNPTITPPVIIIIIIILSFI